MHDLITMVCAGAMTMQQNCQVLDNVHNLDHALYWCVDSAKRVANATPLNIPSCLQVTLTVASDENQNSLQARTYTLTRERIAIKPVTSQMCESISRTVGPAESTGKLGYVRIATFNKQTTESAKAAFRQLKADGATRSALCISLHADSVAYIRCCMWRYQVSIAH